MLRELLHWWVEQLIDLLPEQWRRFDSGHADATILTPLMPLSSKPEAVTVSLRRNGREETLGQFSLGKDNRTELAQFAGKFAVVRLREDDVLSKTLVLPLAVERQLEQALAFEMDRETPFGCEELFWGHRVLKRDRRAGQILVRLLLVPRTSLEELIGALDRLGLRPWRAEIAAGRDSVGFIPLNPAERPNTPSRWLMRPALGCFIFLALVAIGLPFARQAWELAMIERAIDAERAGASEAEKLRLEIDRLSGSADLIESERLKSGRPLAVLAALSALLPADTYLTDFVEQEGKITLTGRSPQASRLIALLTKGEGLRNPTFAAPVTHIAASQTEAFMIKAEAVP